MSNLTLLNRTFEFDILNTEIEIYQDESGDYWFHGATLCDIFDFTNSTQDIQRHVDEDWRKKYPFRGREAWYVAEPGLYQLIHASKNPAAKRFQKWVYSEVLPKLRADGGYIMPTATSEQLQGLRSQIDRYESRLNGILDSFAKIEGDWQNHKHPRLVVLAQQELVRSQHTVEEKEMVRKLFQIHSTSIAPESWIPIAQLAKFTKEFTGIDVPHGLLTVWLAEWGHPYRGRYSDMYSVLMNAINEKTRQKIKEHGCFAAK